MKYFTFICLVLSILLCGMAIGKEIERRYAIRIYYINGFMDGIECMSEAFNSKESDSDKFIGKRLTGKDNGIIEKWKKGE